MLVFYAIMGVFAIFGGVYCIFFPSATDLNPGWIVGILFFLLGICLVIDYAIDHSRGKGDSKRAASGVGGLIFGIAAIVFTIVSNFSLTLKVIFYLVIIILFTLFILVDGITGIINFIHRIKNPEVSNKIPSFILSIIESIVCILALICYFCGFFQPTSLIGIMLIAYGLRLLSSLLTPFADEPAPSKKGGVK